MSGASTHTTSGYAYNSRNRSPAASTLAHGGPAVIASARSAAKPRCLAMVAGQNVEAPAGTARTDTGVGTLIPR